MVIRDGYTLRQNGKGPGPDRFQEMTKYPIDIENSEEHDGKDEQILLDFKPTNKKLSDNDRLVDGLLDARRQESGLEHVEQVKDRGVWANKLEFFLAIVGYTVGISSVWRFPIICSRNGGGAFLIPFFFFLITSGGPLYYLEVCLGQFTGESAGLAFQYCPLFKGLGMLQVVLSFVVIWYCMVIMAWVLYFVYSSFYSVLPWTTCNNAWNTVNCTEISTLWSRTQDTEFVNNSSAMYNISAQTSNSSAIHMDPFKHRSSADEFWNYHVVGRSCGLEDLGGIQLHLVICLFLSWVFCVAAVIKGVKTLGKVVYVTATAPYVLLTVMFIKGLTLDGAMDGIKAYVTPDLSKLSETQSTIRKAAVKFDLGFINERAFVGATAITIMGCKQVWLEAAVQVFYTLGPSWGGVITMASYNKFHQKSFWSSTICVVCGGFTSFYNGLVVFTILGFMAKTGGKSVIELAQESGSGLAFVAFPTALSLMPVPQLWSVLFFVTLIAVVFDSLFGMFETVTSGIIDLFPRHLVKRRMLVNILMGLVFFVTGLPLTMNGGIYIVQLFDWYVSSFALLLGSFVECASICWIYGTDRFARDIQLMTGRDVSVVLRVMWTLLIPLLVGITFIILLTRYSAPSYGDGYVYSTTSVAIGVFIGMLPIISMIAVGAVSIVREKGSLLQRLKESLRPSVHWAPNDRAALEEYRLKPYIYPRTWWRRFVLNIRGTKENPLF